MRRFGLAVVLSAVLYFCVPFPWYGHNVAWRWLCVLVLVGGTPLWIYWAGRFVVRTLRRLRAGDTGDLQEDAETDAGFLERLRGLLVVCFCCLYLLAVADQAHFVSDRIQKSRMARATSDIRNMDVACTKMVADADLKSLLAFFNDIEGLRQRYGTYANAWNAAVPELLRNGNRTALDLKPGVRKKLPPSFMQVGNDPWGRPYHFFAGPLDSKVYGDATLVTRFRSYREPARPFYVDRNGYQQTGYYYDAQAKQEELAGLGAGSESALSARYPEPDGLPGFPAPVDLPVYIWSMGADGKSCQRIGADLSPENVKAGPNADSGDDINNWDSQRGWRHFYGGER
jgi:hypothetical protein